jgi:hypothetical protein
MCEPHHSIVQYPIDDGDNDNTTRLQWGLGKIFDWGKKIGSWFHFSKLGSGHTESIEWSKTKGLLLPNDTRYETDWWIRRVRLDSFDRSHETDRALAAARQYSEAVCIGDIQKFRRFFETSIQKSDRPRIYFLNFIERMLTQPARDEIALRVQRIWGKSLLQIGQIKQTDRLCSLLLGYTRKRNLLVPEWADENKLWTTGT